MKLTTACLTTTQQHKNNINNNSDKNHSKRAKHSNKQQGVKQNVHLTTPTHKKLCLKSFQNIKKKKKDKSWWYNASRCWTPQFFVEIMLPRRKQNTSISNRFKKKKARVTYGLLGGTRKGLAEHSNRVFIRHPPRQRPNTEREQACLFSFSLPPQTSSILFCNFYAYTCFFFFVVTKKQIQLSKETLYGVLCISVQGRFTHSGPSLPFAQYFAK